MPLLHILQIPHPALRKIAQPVEVVDDQIRQIASDMLETMYTDNGVGLAAIQVNIQKRIVVLDISDTRDEPHIFINPKIVSEKGRETFQEGCMSVPGFWEMVERAASVTVEALNEKGEPFTMELTGLFADCIQHEIDHLDGVLFIDHLSSFKRDRILKKFEKLAKQKML